MDYKEIGLRIKKYRRELKMTQQQLADEIGRAESSVRKYEKGEVEIPISVLNTIASSLKITLNELMGWSKEYTLEEEIKEKLNFDLFDYVNELKEKLDEDDFLSLDFNPTEYYLIADELIRFIIDNISDFDFIFNIQENIFNNIAIKNELKSIENINSTIEELRESIVEKIKIQSIDAIQDFLLNLSNTKNDVILIIDRISFDAFNCIKTFLVNNITIDYISMIFSKLNEFGKEKAFEYIIDLSEQPKYTDKE